MKHRIIRYFLSLTMLLGVFFVSSSNVFADNINLMLNGRQGDIVVRDISLDEYLKIRDMSLSDYLKENPDFGFRSTNRTYFKQVSYIQAHSKNSNFKAIAYATFEIYEHDGFRQINRVTGLSSHVYSLGLYGTGWVQTGTGSTTCPAISVNVTFFGYFTTSNYVNGFTGASNNRSSDMQISRTYSVY